MKIKYQTDKYMVCITPCPFFDGIKVGTGACMSCGSFYGKDMKRKLVNCNRKVLEDTKKKRVKQSEKKRS